MGKVRRVLRCYNCGTVLQSKKASEKGYVPAELLDGYTGDNQVLYCQKCFDEMKSINTGALEQNIDKQTAKILDDAVATDAYIIYVVDLFKGTSIDAIHFIETLLAVQDLVIPCITIK